MGQLLTAFSVGVQVNWGQVYDCRIFMETLQHFRSAAFICVPAHSLRSLNDGTER